MIANTIIKTRFRRCVISVALGIAMAATAVTAVQSNGFGESQPYQFRSDADRNVRLNVERTRLEQDGELGVGSASGLGALGSQGGEPSANRSSITINGNNNNVGSIGQESTGNQSTNNTLNGGVNSSGN